MPPSLSEIVVAEELASSEVVSSAIAAAAAAGVPLVAWLVREVGIDEAALAGALSKVLRMGLAEPSRVEADSEAIRRLDRETCRNFRVMPIGLLVTGSGPTRMKLVMADPTDAQAISEIESQTGCDIEPAIATLSGVELLVEENYRHMVTEVMNRKPRGKFGGSLQVGTSPHARTANETVPFHRIADEAELSIRLDALVKVLIDRGVLPEDEYDEAIRELMKQRQ